MRKILLISLGAFRGEYPYLQSFGYITSPGIRYVKAALNEYGFITEIIDQPNDNLTDFQIITKIKEIDPDVLLFNQFFSTRRQIRGIIDLLPDKYIIGIGGHDVTFQVNYLSESELNKSYQKVDFLWRGEAEKGLPKFIDTLKKTERVSIIDNLTNRVRDLDTLPRISHDDYTGESGFIVTSRGCFSNGCDFCSTSRFYPDGWKGRSYSHVESELINLKKNNRNYVAVFDDNFFGFTEHSFERGVAIINKCKELDIKIIFLMASVAQIVKLKEQGYLQSFRGTLNNVFLGMENIDENVLKVLGKKCDIKNYKKLSSVAIDALHSDGISLFLGYINFNPYTTIEELENNARFLYENHCQASQFLYLSKKLQLFEGTKIFDNYIKENDISIMNISGAEYNYNFKDNKVGSVSPIMKFVQNETMMFDCIDYEISTVLSMNQLQNSIYGQEYQFLKEDISNNNYAFFMKVLDICRTDNNTTVRIFDCLNEYKEKARGNIMKAKELYFKIIEQSKYIIQEPIKYISRIII